MLDIKEKRHIQIVGKGGGGQSESVEWDNILNKPDFATVATSGDYDDLTDKPTILTQWFGTQEEYDDIQVKDPDVVYNIEGGGQVQANWTENDSSDPSYIQNKPTLATVATSGSYSDLSNTPSLATVATSGDYTDLSNKPEIPSVPPMATESLTFTLQGGTTKTIEFYTVPNYFYVEDISGSNNTLSITKSSSSAPTIEVFKSTDKMNWESMGTTSTTAITATIPANGKLYLKANANALWCRNNEHNTMSASGKHNVGGNILSLIYGDNFEGKTTLPTTSYYSYSGFTQLFMNNTKLINANNLILPLTTTIKGVYNCMFWGCTNLVTAPSELPAATLTDSCYGNMFRGCTSLTTAPALPATTLNGYCYSSMFNGCTSLTTAPALPATSLADSCYGNMFQDCTSLTTAPALPATKLAQMCYMGIFQGCTSLTTAPALPATKLAQMCYMNMFKGCTSLTTVPTDLLPATNIPQQAYTTMFQGCTSLTTAPALPATQFNTSVYVGMFQGCTSLTTAPALPATNVNMSCYANMFQGCTSLTTAPALPATKLATSCYTNMFQGCTNLNKVTTYAQDISASNCLSSWLSGVSAQGDFWNLGGATFQSGASGIPSGWTEHTSL